VIVGDDVTVAYSDPTAGVEWELRRDRVRALRAHQFVTAFTNRMYDLADEGITWVKGFHEPETAPLHSLLAYRAMAETE